MNRLTNSDLISAAYSPWELCGLDKDCLRSCEECNIVEMYKKLAAYEDIGLKPEELQEMVDRQKWHVVAEGDLPPKLKDGKRAKTYLITKQNGRNDTRKSIDFAFWNGEAFGRERKCNIGVSGVFAWRELPEPWEGANKQCENG